ncbi:DUF2125 domain-containing protein [Magnetospira sp. QH-2]|uniref:DUF2125 domain-containing protein n=1 Tax=Magnetospira sp. (strain QH-2) TaxID=1288970 RepID=UPI0003E81184|nr:DUF2125 domain-containing protein [Magnetospira sp. QH-2]CCQ74821.1 protein of unknown function [Magnetospira sp. QH-2]
MAKQPPLRLPAPNRKTFNPSPGRAPVAGRQPHPAMTYEPSKLLRVFTQLAITTAITLIAAAIYTGYWYFMGSLMRDEVGNWVAYQKSRGIEISYDEVTLTGFPGYFRVGVTNANLSGGKGQGAWAMASPEIRLLGAPWWPGSAILDLDGVHDLSGPAVGRWPVQVTATTLRAEFDLFDGEWPDHIVVTAANLLAAPSAGRPLLTIGQLTLNTERFPEGGSEDPTFTLTIDGRNLDGAGFLDPMQEVKIKASLLGGLPGGPVTPALMAWRDANGTLAIEQLTLGQGRTRVMATGTIALDDKLAPVGDATAKVVGFNDMLENLRNAGVIRSREATMARIILAAFAKPQKQGPPALSVPIKVADRTLSAGPAGLLTIPEVDWASLNGWLAPLQQPLPPPQEDAPDSEN